MTTPNNTVAGLPAKMDMHSPALIIRYGVDYLDGWNSAVEAMQAALALPAPSAGVGVEGWVSVADRLPPVDTMVQVRLAGGMNGESLAIGESTRKSGTRDEREWTITSGGLYRYWGQQCDGGSVTHWRRLAPFTPPAAAPSAPPSVAGDAGELPRRYRLTLEGGTTGWGVYPEPDEAGEWCKFSEVQQHDLFRRLATAEQPGSAVQGEAVAEVGPGWQLLYIGSGPIAEICRLHPELRIGSKLYTTPPPAPAAEQGDATCDCPRDHRGQHIYVCPERPLAFGLHDPAAAFNQDQPEARGVDGIVVTDEMLNAGQEALCALTNFTHWDDEHQAAIYRAMFAAAPSGVRVDDAMVERACIAYKGGVPSDAGREMMRAALTAVLSANEVSRG